MAFFVHTVKINLSLSPEEIVSTTGRKDILNPEAVRNLLYPYHETVPIVFFKPGRSIKDVDFEKEFTPHGLVPVDPVSLAVLNTEDPGFADKFPNCTQWKNLEGKRFHIMFGEWDGVREVVVDQTKPNRSWGDFFWYAGMPKEMAE